MAGIRSRKGCAGTDWWSWMSWQAGSTAAAVQLTMPHIQESWSSFHIVQSKHAWVVDCQKESLCQGLGCLHLQDAAIDLQAPVGAARAAGRVQLDPGP